MLLANTDLNKAGERVQFVVKRIAEDEKNG